MKKIFIALCLLALVVPAALAVDADTAWRESVRTSGVTQLFTVAVSFPGSIAVASNVVVTGGVTSATLGVGVITATAKPVFTQAAVAAPTNTAARGFAITVNGTNYVVGLYPN